MSSSCAFASEVKESAASSGRRRFVCSRSKRTEGEHKSAALVLTFLSLSEGRRLRRRGTLCKCLANVHRTMFRLCSDLFCVLQQQSQLFCLVLVSARVCSRVSRTQQQHALRRCLARSLAKTLQRRVHVDTTFRHREDQRVVVMWSRERRLVVGAVERTHREEIFSVRCHRQNSKDECSRELRGGFTERPRTRPEPALLLRTVCAVGTR